MNYLEYFLFAYYPYICLTVFLLGSLLRFDREQYTWKSDSSQLLRAGQLRWGSNLFHVSILFLLFGHAFGLLTPSFVYEAFMTAGDKKLLAMVSGGFFGVLGFIGVSLLLHRRLSDTRIRQSSRPGDILLLWLFWMQFALGLVSVVLSVPYMDGSKMVLLAEWSQRIVTFRGDAPQLLAEVGWVIKLHLVLGMTIFLIFPFTRLVHIWSGFATLAYLRRPYQVVRSRRLSRPSGALQNQRDPAV